MHISKVEKSFVVQASIKPGIRNTQRKRNEHSKIFLISFVKRKRLEEGVGEIKSDTR